jgi:hypothetical protein
LQESTSLGKKLCPIVPLIDPNYASPTSAQMIRVKHVNQKPKNPFGISTSQLSMCHNSIFDRKINDLLAAAPEMW